MYLFEKQKFYLAKSKAEGHTWETVSQRLAQTVALDSKCDLDAKYVNEHLITFRLYKKQLWLNWPAWVFYGQINELDNDIIIRGHFSFNTRTKILLYGIYVFSLLMLIMFLFPGGTIYHHGQPMQYISTWALWWNISPPFLIIWTIGALNAAMWKLSQRTDQRNIEQLLHTL